MASFEPQDFGFDEPPPRPTTPPVRRGFLLVLFVLCLMAGLVYGIPYVAERTGYAWEAGRSPRGVRGAGEARQGGDRQPRLRAVPDGDHGRLAGGRPRSRRGGSAGAAASRRWAGRARAWASRASASARASSSTRTSGYIVTNNHVIKDADQIVVRLSHGNDVPARLVGADPKTDLAVLQVTAGLKVAAEWGDSDKLDIGDWVLAIGSPFALDHTVTAGIVSATERNDLRINEYESFIQTDAAINPGNSGGPLIDLTGKVVGINTAIITQNRGYEGIGLAIPSAMARRVVEGLIKEGQVVRGYLGVGIQPVNSALAKDLALPDTRGALVREVQPGSPAARAGSRSATSSSSSTARRSPTRRASGTRPPGWPSGRRSPWTYFREGKRQTVTVTIAELEGAPTIASAIGFRVRELPRRRGGRESHPGDRSGRRRQPGRAGRPATRYAGRRRRRTPVHTKAEFEAAIASYDRTQGLPLKVETPDGQIASVRVGGPTTGRR